MLRQIEIDALSLLRPVSMTVKPDFYVRFTRWMAREMIKEEKNLSPFSSAPHQLGVASVASDEHIIRDRLGDAYQYRGASIRLAEPDRRTVKEPNVPPDSFEARFTY